MAVRLLKKQIISGVQRQAGEVVTDLAPDQEDRLAQGGDAVRISLGGALPWSLAASLGKAPLGLVKQLVAPLTNQLSPITPSTSVSNPIITVGASYRAWDSGLFSYPSGDAKVAGVGYPDYLGCRHVNITNQVQLVQNIVTEFDFDGQAFEVYGKKCASACLIRVIADGLIVHAGRAYAPGGAAGDLIFVLFDLGSAAPRRIKIECTYFYFNGIQALSSTSIKPVDYSNDQLLIGLGDSFEEGANTHQWDAANVLLAKRLGIKRYWPSGLGSTGYLANAGGAQLTFRQRVAADVIAYQPKGVHVSGSVNDLGQTAAAVGAEATLLYAAIRAGLPNAFLWVTGVYAPGTPTTQALLNNAALKAACLAAGGLFIDPLQSPGPWIGGTGKFGAANGSGNSDWATAADGTHPTGDGHSLICDRKADYFLPLA